MLSNGSSLGQMLLGRPQGMGSPQGVVDSAEVLSRNGGGNDIIVEIVVTDCEQMIDGVPVLERIQLVIDRGFAVSLSGTMSHGISIPFRNSEIRGGNRIFQDDRPVAHIGDILKAFSVLASTKYVGPFRNALNVTQDRPYFDISVGRQVIGEWRDLKLGQNIARSDLASRLEFDIRAIFGYDDFRLEASQDATEFLLFVNRNRFRMQELGAGIAQFVLAFMAAAVNPQQLLLIDEPEINLHPTMQMAFLTALGSYFNFGVVFATHSLGLARASADSIYSFRRISEGESEVGPFEATTSAAELLGELSFGAYQDLGFNRVLLVEGPTEVKAFHQLLRILDKDHEVVVLPLGGSSLINANSAIELAEVKRLSSDVAAVIDSEKSSATDSLSPEREAFRENCEKTGIRCHVLERRAFENYLPDRAIKAAIDSAHRALAPYEQLKDSERPWGKPENWRITREMTRGEFEATGDLSAFLHRFLSDS